MFDTGEHGVGGRLATRASADGSLSGAPPGSELVFDHAAQYFTAADPAFAAMVADWQAAGVVEEWRGPVGALRAGAFTPDPSPGPRYVARGGMRRLATHLAGQASRALRDSSGGGGSGGVDVKSEWPSLGRISAWSTLHAAGALQAARLLPGCTTHPNQLCPCPWPLAHPPLQAWWRCGARSGSARRATPRTAGSWWAAAGSRASLTPWSSRTTVRARFQLGGGGLKLELHR